MPLVTAALSIPVIATILSLPAAAIVIEQPTFNDSYALLGAILASLITLIEGRHRGRPLLPLVANFLGSAAAGSFFPNIAFLLLVQWGWIEPAKHAWARTWHAWSAAGFVCGMNGWWIIHRATGLMKAFEAAAKRR
jgi:hypothetical protein